MSEERSVDVPERCGKCPIDSGECPAVVVSNTGSRVVFCERENTDGWIASDAVIEIAEMR